MSEPSVRKTLAARIDLAGCYAFIGERSPDAAMRFVHAAEATFAALARMPGAGAPYQTSKPRVEEVRCSRIHRFKKYLIIYRPIEGGIEVLRVLHTARNIDAILGAE